jgi:hypothetical protein
MKFRYYFFKENTRTYDKAELLTYLEAQPYVTLKTDGDIKKAYYNNTVLNFNALLVINNKSIVPNIDRLDPKYLDLKIYCEFDVLTNTYLVDRFIDMIEVICKRFDFCVYNEYFEGVSQFKRSLMIHAFEVVKQGYKNKYEEEFVNYSRLDKKSLNKIYAFEEIKQSLNEEDEGKILPYVYFKEKGSRNVYVGLLIDSDAPFILPPCAELIKLKRDDDYIIISYQDFYKKVSKYLEIVDSNLYDVLKVKEKNMRKVRKLLIKTKFDFVKVPMEEVDFNKILDL